MYRKEKVAVAVDNYKRKKSDEEESNESSEESESETESEESKKDKVRSGNKNRSDKIESVKPVKSSVSLVEKSQVDGFNMFLSKVKESSINKNNNNIQNNNKTKSFDILDPTKKYLPPGAFTVTSITQAHDLLRVTGTGTNAATEQSSEEWLKMHSLDAIMLTIEDLINKGKLGQPRPDMDSAEVLHCLVFDEMTVTEFEYKVNLAIAMYSKRIKWFLQGSRKMFGLIGGSQLGIIIDSSNANLGFGRSISLQENLFHLLDEQLYKKNSVNIGFFGSDVQFIWESPMNLNCRVIEEAKEAFTHLLPMGGCNLLQAIKQITYEKSIDQVMLIVGTCPDQETQMLLTFFQQLLLGRNLPFHCVSYESQSEEVDLILKKIADMSNGNYHRYSSLTEELTYTSNDIDLILQEIEKAQEVLAKIGLMREGLFNNKISPVITQIAQELKNLPQSDFLPKPASFNEPLQFEVGKFEPKSSSAWLNSSGLKAKKLGLYTILGPNSYESKSEFVPSIGRMVTSSVYEKAMIQVIWPDGTSRNVHADLAQLFEYQKVLGEQVKLMEQRINWLATGSRRLFGTVIEKKVVFILDLSISNLKYLVHIQQSLKSLIQQQLMSKDKFNIIAFSNNIITFRPCLVKISEKVLQEAWTWIKNLRCGGSRNFLGALRIVLENSADDIHHDQAQGIYLFTSGVPDQSTEPLLSYIEERLLGTDTKIHTVLFNVDDYDNSGTPIPSRYANITKTAEIMRLLAHTNNGRFHWFRESGIIESDDIRVIMSEVDLAVEYSRRVQQIIKDFKEKYPDSHSKRTEMSKQKVEIDICRRDSVDNMIALPAPRPTSLTKARKQYLSTKAEEANKIPKTLAYRTEVDAMKSVMNNKSNFDRHISTAFYTEDKNSKGVVYRDPEFRGTRKGIGKTEIPNKEEWISSSDWLKKYSLKSMGLHLLRLVSGPDCVHEESLVAPLDKFVEAKYCSGLFPIVNVRGTRKHMQFIPSELLKYDAEAKKALLRYLKRLEWLMIGSKRIFGVIIEKAVVVLLDTSGSMNPHMPELILNLKALIWEQLFKRKITFNLIAFNSQISRFRERMVVPNEVNCHSAIGWVEHLVASGNTDTTKALLITLEDASIEAIYLLSDGKPDSSTEIVLNTVKHDLIQKKSNVKIHTISFNCEDNAANQFLKDLSKATSGRYHKVCHNFDIRIFSQQVVDQCQNIKSHLNSEFGDGDTVIAADILSFDPYYPPLPTLDGDDFSRITKEIQTARISLSKTNYFRQLYFQMKKLQEDKRKEAVKITKNDQYR